MKKTLILAVCALASFSALSATPKPSKTVLTKLNNTLISKAGEISEFYSVSGSVPLYVEGINTNLLLSITLTHLPESLSPELKKNAKPELIAKYEQAQQQNKALSHQLFSLEKITNKSKEQVDKYQLALAQKEQAANQYNQARAAIFGDGLKSQFYQALSLTVANNLCDFASEVDSHIKTPTLTVHIHDVANDFSDIWLYQTADIAKCGVNAITPNELASAKQQQVF